ncbi:hypothetical protein ACFL49_00980 [Candidatus Omnitrophota bacterium]
MKPDDYSKYYKLLAKQNWLSEKDTEFFSLIKSCKNEDQKKLVFDLLSDFNYLNSNMRQKYLGFLASYIINETGFAIEKTQIVGMSMDSNPDSGDWLLHQLRPFLTRMGWNDVKVTPKFYSGVKQLNKKGLTQLVLVDEFIGSGQSVEGRINFLKKNAKIEYEIKACFIAGMEFGINNVSKSFADFKCFLPLKKGISDKYTFLESKKAIAHMRELESNLLQQIKDKNLKDYHLGFNNAEALYSSEVNTPNSVFPFFWWPYDSKKSLRTPILTRNEVGLSL